MHGTEFEINMLNKSININRDLCLKYGTGKTLHDRKKAICIIGYIDSDENMCQGLSQMLYTVVSSLIFIPSQPSVIDSIITSFFFFFTAKKTKA